MPPTRPTYAFDVEGHTVVVEEPEQPEKKRKAHMPDWLSQALNEGDGVYRP